MLHAKFQDHQTSGSGEEDFNGFFTIYGHGSHLSPVTWTIYIISLPPFYMKVGLDWPSGL